MKLRKIWSMGGESRERHSLDPPLPRACAETILAVCREGNGQGQDPVQHGAFQSLILDKS